MIEAANITKFYGMRPVLRDITLQVTSGEFVAILGPNGAGKTTLLKVVATLIKPDHGRLRINGADAIADPSLVRAGIGVVSHQSLVYPDLTAVENLRFYADMYGLPRSGSAGIQGIEADIMEALKRVDLGRRAHDPVRTYSRGMVQRLSIARALIHNPPLLLLDEPYTGLDHTSAATLSAILREMAVKGRTVLMTTHEYRRGLDGVTRAIIIKGGKVTHELAADLSAEKIDQLAS